MNNNKMATKPINRLFWSMGLPMVFSMVLQALYNVVDTVFIINMGETGIKANLALTYVFPVQIFMIAVGVGTGIGINALLSRGLGEKNQKKIGLTLGNGIFLGLCIYLIFLLFGLFASRWFMFIQTNDEEIIRMGSEYLTIVTTLSFGAIGFNVFERFLQATGKTMHSTISQVVGALINIVLDYVFIYPLNMGVAGAAYATVIGQIASLLVAVLFHYLLNKEVKHSFKDIVPNIKIIGSIYKVAWAAMLMQALLSINMFVMIKVFSVSPDGDLINGTYGIYYKIQQIALFSCFGLSNTIISLLSFNIGLNDKMRIKECIKWGIIDTVIVAGIITILFELLAGPIANLFGLTTSGENKEQIINLCKTSIRIASIGYVFMGVSLAIQGILQAYRKSVTPLIISLLRLIVLLVPFALLFVNSNNAVDLVWWSFPIAELLTMIISLFILFKHIRIHISI
ncbi:MAG: MATE family efflux transporter [Erysipelotrichaceae bacterium]|nr:MATE family efflux transporter [Erysipelotrichaceae bacterium]